MNGYILIHRKLSEWQWYQDSSTLHLFIDLLLDANYEDSMVGLQKVKRGQCLTSLKRISQRTGLSYRQIRTSLDKLQKSGEIDKQATNRYSIITINKYDDYQDIDKQKTNKRQTKDNIKEINKEKEYKESISKDIPKKKFLKPTIQEIADYCKERNNGIDADYFYDFYESKGWMVGSNNMKNWKACVRTWEKQSKKSEYKKEALPSWFNNEQKGIQLNDEEQRLYDELTRGS